MRRHPSRRSHSNRLAGLYDDPNMLIAAGIGIALIAYLLWPKKAKAETVPPREKSPDVPTPAPSAGSSTTTPTPSKQQFSDPATGVAVDGPSGKIGAGIAYAVQKGESWSNIASRVFGDYRWWPFLWDYNRTPQTFQNPDKLNVGDSISIPASTPQDATYRDRIFQRAAAHRQYWLDKAKGKAVTMPAIVSEQTPVPL